MIGFINISLWHSTSACKKLPLNSANSKNNSNRVAFFAMQRYNNNLSMRQCEPCPSAENDASA